MKTVTIGEARKRHQGVSARQLQNLLLRKQMKGKKVGNRWHIPLSELDRIFGG